MNRLMPIAEVARRTGIPERQVMRAWKDGLRKLGIVEGLPLGYVRIVVDAVRERNEPRALIGCGSVECRRDWIERNGDWFEL